MECCKKPEKLDLDRRVLKPLLEDGLLYGYQSPEYVKDMGTPERYEMVQRDIRSGLVSAKNLANPQKAVFLDRDGRSTNMWAFAFHRADGASASGCTGDPKIK